MVISRHHGGDEDDNLDIKTADDAGYDEGDGENE